MEQIGVGVATALLIVGIVDTVKDSYYKNTGLYWKILAMCLGVLFSWGLADAGVNLNLWAVYGTKDTIFLALLSGATIGILGSQTYDIFNGVRERVKG